MTRNFTATTAIRTRVPGLVAFVGPPGGGKTLSALKFARGMAKALQALGLKGKIGVIDSEACRALHYAPKKGEVADFKFTFDFEHLDFKTPHGPEDYAAATDFMLKERGVDVLIYDSISHEHIGTGGVLERFTKFVEELSKAWQCSAGAATPSAWNKAKEPRKKFINQIEQTRDHFFILNFRAKEGVDFEKKGKAMDLGWEPEGGKEIFYQIGLSCLLPSRSDGKPIWTSPRLGDSGTMKLPYWAKGIVDDGKPIGEEHGQKVAEWLLGEGNKTLAIPDGPIAPVRMPSNPEAVPKAPPATISDSPVMPTDPADLSPVAKTIVSCLRGCKNLPDLEAEFDVYNTKKGQIQGPERIHIINVRNAVRAELEKQGNLV